MQLALRSLLLVMLFSGLAGAAEKRPNIVVFLVDDMGLMDSSVPFVTDRDGAEERHPLNDFYRTPNMRRLADQGVRFSRFYAMSVCSPTRASIMTGQNSARHHTTQYIKPESNNAGAFGPPGWKWSGIAAGDVTLPGLLKAAGYRTIHCGKAHFGPIGSPAEDPTSFGFDVNIAGCSYGQPGSYYGKKNFGHGIPKRQKRAVPGLEKYHGKDVHLSEALTLEINEAISASVQAGEPFFAYMSHYAVHTPFEPDPRFAGHYEGSKKPLAAFASLIEGMDKSLGDMLDHLDELGVAEDTLVLFLGDNGTDAPVGGTHDVACAAPLRGKKGTHYEGGMRVPFIAAWAKPASDHPAQQRTPIQRGTITRQLGAVYDLLPTLLGVAGVAQPDKATIDGRDLRRFFSPGKVEQESREFLMHFPHQHRSSYFTSYYRDGWKLIYHYRPQKGAGRGGHELFKLSEDRSESKNLAGREPEKLRSMIAAMSAALEKCGAQYPLADDKQTPLKPGG